MFIVKFHKLESPNKVVEEGVQMFDRKPIVVKPWRLDMECTKDSIERIPVWVRLMALDITYWGKCTLTKIVGLIGKSLRADSATTRRRG